MSGAGVWRLGTVALLVAVLASCATKRFSPPTDVGVPFPQFAEVYAQVTRACSGVRTFTAELGLSGRAGAQRLRGRMVVGFMEPDAMRLEGLAPLGPPAFVLAAQGGRATLLLPRDNSVVRDADPRELLAATTGVDLGPADLQAVLTGCVTTPTRPRGGRALDNGWTSIDTELATLFLRLDRGQWRLTAARRAGWIIEYGTWLAGFPTSVRLRSEGATAPVDVLATVSQLEANVDINREAFVVSAPAGADVLTVEDLRRRGALGGAP